MRRFKLFSLFQERVAQRMCPSRWSARRRASWSASGGSAAVESLESRCLLIAGGLDPTFGAGGGAGILHGDAFDVAIQSDGKIVVAGYTDADLDGNYDFALARYNTNGTLDSSFDGDGVMATDFGMSDDFAKSVVLQTDGKIVIAGYAHTHNGGNYDFALARYNIDGSLDTTFDGDGKLTTDFGTTYAIAHSLALQTDGKIVVAGVASDGSGSGFALARFNSDGTLDTSFDNDGKLITHFGASSDAQSLIVQNDGKIIVAGYEDYGQNRDFEIARYNSNGSLDTSFDGDGKLTTNFGNDDYAASATLQSNGKIIVVGRTVKNNDNNFALVRYNSDGSLDTSFDSDGKLTTDFGPGDDFANSVAVQLDGKIVVAGSTLARYNADGSLDTSFAVSRVSSASMALQADGKIVVAGSGFSLARFNNTNSNEPPTITSVSSINVAENTTRPVQLLSV